MNNALFALTTSPGVGAFFVFNLGSSCVQ